ncbi:MAG TPA: urocanate hydratase [Saprospiraceae bacterium]|nr:urocanate hydratase [Saprospiraceae bacterium]
MTEDIGSFQYSIKQGIPSDLPVYHGRDEAIQHAPVRNIQNLSVDERRLALANALRYFPQEHHEILSAEFALELEVYGRIYMYRFRPSYPMHARPIDQYPARCHQAAAIMLMIQNNLDPLVAKYPHELITYGGNGAVFQNWAQYLLTMKYLSEMTMQQTLVLYSGHPLGLFPSPSTAPRVVVSNGMMIPNHSSKDNWNKFNAMGVTQYGQMTAGSFMYIGPQGIVHGTTITLLNAGRLKGLGANDLRGKSFVTSGLGGMSGAQARAILITGATGIIAEVDSDAIQQRLADKYIKEEDVFQDLNTLLAEFVAAKDSGIARCFVYHGNIVDLWETIVEKFIHIELGSDQTSCHNMDQLGYCPAGYSFEEAKKLLQNDKAAFDEAVKESLRRQIHAINILAARGMYFWDYGNAFLLEAGKAGAMVMDENKPSGFRYASYVEDIMGPMCFDYGFGPFRWVCTSGENDDLVATDKIAAETIRDLIVDCVEGVKEQWQDNLNWIEQARINIPPVGSKSRILYADAEGRIEIARRFNKAIREGILKAPVVLGRDHHDVSGTDAPWRETANIYDGSKFTADMAIQNVIGDAMRHATWVSIHNGGGTGWGEAINGGFGLVLDGSEASDHALKSMLFWDVNNGIARRAWARNPHAMSTAIEAMKKEENLEITMPNLVEDSLLDQFFT